MSNFAHLNENNIVDNVISVPASHGAILVEFSSSEDEFSSPEDIVWKYSDGNNRGNLAGIGMTYMVNVATLGVGSTDIFINPQPHASWTIGINTAQWYAPIAKPGLTTTQEAAHMVYHWDESAYQADNTKGWILFDPSA